MDNYSNSWDAKIKADLGAFIAYHMEECPLFLKAKSLLDFCLTGEKVILSGIDKCCKLLIRA